MRVNQSCDIAKTTVVLCCRFLKLLEMAGVEITPDGCNACK
jgi:hypothetical protein